MNNRLYRRQKLKSRIPKLCCGKTFGFAPESPLAPSDAMDATEGNRRQALATAQKLASQHRAVEDRIAQLEAEVQHYREKSDRAEAWLRKISTEIEDRLTNQSMERRREVFGRP